MGLASYEVIESGLGLAPWRKCGGYLRNEGTGFWGGGLRKVRSRAFTRLQRIGACAAARSNAG